MKNLLFSIFALTFLVSFKSDEVKPAKDYLGVGKSLMFNEHEFHLTWSGNPSVGYYKQEYLLDSTTIENYNEMLLIEAIKGNISPELAANAKVAELQQLKEDNPTINWNVYEGNGEIIIDFVITDKATIYEWNLYRYAILKDVNKQKYLVLRAYSFKDKLYSNDDLKPFFNKILENRDDYIAKLGKLELPKLNVSGN